jgi:hypothetical protein
MGVYYSEGDYSCEVKQQGFEKAKTGKDMIVFVFRPEAIVAQDDEGNQVLDSSIHTEWDRTCRIVLDPSNEKVMEYAMKKLRHAGFTGESFKDLDFVGKQIIFRCKYSNYNGGEVEQWEMPLPALESREVPPLDNNAARRLDALFGKKLKEGSSKPKSDPAPKQTVPDAGDDDKDCPF